ncbi:unnamed protein product [Bursaphelenchus okinawaensis]|uniref:Dihydroorotate dehydrogenase (quinone), mitochondrial n=1 Tax=Bursaphelenchus okinawaensis TaxID=465554 RepID=A0A811LEY3_9BILA|nr:unnamed protein product [Bursaphelenchus okinawaensis]CAG9121788.1 unnamed protein product [Bursaphelenchus okinawaensis]
MKRAQKPFWTVKKVVQCGVAGTGAFAFSQLLFGSEYFYANVVMPTVHAFVDPETAHKLGVKSAKYGLIPRFGDNVREYAQLQTKVMGIDFQNPIGIAAGFDKDGEAIEGLQKSGLGFVEIGSVTPRPQPGNEKPRVFRLPEDKALINRYGFNSKGVGYVSDKVKAVYKGDDQDVFRNRVPVGVNLGKNKDTEFAALDYEIGADYFANFCDYLVINVSSPNTPGLRALQSKTEIENILSTFNQAVDRMTQEKGKRPKVLLKITSDLNLFDRRDIANVAVNPNNRIDGLIISNTTIERPDDLKCLYKHETGGLSGEPLKKASTECIKEMYKLTGGAVPIIGVGGVSNGTDVYEKIRAGASLVQFYTALVYEGWPVIGKMKKELREHLFHDGFGTVSSAVGADVRLEEQQKIIEKQQRSWWKFW